MASGGQPKSELERLKAKYLTRAEEFDRDEEAMKRQIHLLQRMLVRVSLAAEGQSGELDKELDSLRGLLRQESSSASSLSSHLDKIENCVLKLDEKRNDSSDQLLNSLEQLASQLSELDISRTNKKQLKSFSKHIRDKHQRLQNTPGLLNEFAAIQQQALKEQFSGVGEQKDNGGFFQKLFGGKGDAEESSSASEDLPNEQGHHVYEKDYEISEPDGESYSETETELAVEGEVLGGTDEAPGFAKIAGHVGTSLRNLLEQLIIPENALREAERLRSNIEAGLNWYELGPTLDDVANLVISALSKGQRDFENFLQSLDERLLKFGGVLSQALTHQVARQDAGAKLTDAIRGDLQTLSTDVESATDIDVLKQSVTGHLDSILGALSSFMTVEEGREKELKEQLEETRERLQEMEVETKVIKEKLKEERGRALTDTLTQLPNREAYVERFEFEYTRWQRYRQPITIVVGDIDHFKGVNDNYGHLAGDKVIQIMAKELQRRIRKTDFVARFGGEEFVILMPETEADTAFSVIDKARQMVEKLPFHFRKERVQITMSFGVAAFTDGMSKDEVFDVADKALYAAKQQGRNRVVLAGGETPPE